MTGDQQSIDNAAIRIASGKLRDAILAARAGTCVVTPAEPVKLPRDPAPAREAGRKGSVSIPVPESQEDAVLRLFSLGQTYTTIARNLDMKSPQTAQWALVAIKRQTPGRYWRALERHNRARGLVE